MELKQLVIFQTVATNLSFTRSAKLLNYAQSNISSQIHSLEVELGVRLFDRIGKRVGLTEAGRKLLGYSEKIVDLVQEAREVVKEAAEPSGSITLSAPESFCTYCLPALLRQFQISYPQVRVLFQPCPVAELARRVSEGLIDLAFILEEPLQSNTLCIESLGQEPILVVAANDHPLSRSEVVKAADLAGQVILFTETGCSYRNQFQLSLARAGVYPKTGLEFNSVEAIKQCVMSGMGISILPKMAVTKELMEGKLSVLRWEQPELSLLVQMVWHKDKWLSPALNSFLVTVRENFGSQSGQGG